MKALFVDLSTGKIEEEEIGELLPRYLGGVGIGARLAFDLIPQGCDPLGEENVLIFCPGSLVGTNIPTASRTEITAKSPLTGLIGTTNSGLYFGAFLRYAGFDCVVIRGAASEPVYLLIEDGEARIRDAREIWGRDNWETYLWLREREGEKVQVASIGPAGERLVRFASIQNNFFHAWGRTGLGAVMGSKRLKAVAVKGKGAFRVHDLRQVLELAREFTERVRGDDSFGYTRRYGSMVASDPYNRIGVLPGKNFTRGTIPSWEETRGRRVFERRYKEKDLSCFACPIACGHWSRVKEGEGTGYEFHGMEVTYVLEFGAKLQITSIEEIARSVELCDRMGMDVVSTASVIAYAIEASEKGALPSEEVPSWGDPRGIRSLIGRIARREGIGEALAEGVKKASSRFRGTEPYALHIKGAEIPVRDPRGKWDVWSLGYLTDIRGGDHLRARSPAEYLLGGTLNHLEEELHVSEEFIAALDMPDDLKGRIFGSPPQKVDIPLMTKYAEELITMINASGLCLRPPVLRTFGPQTLSHFLRAVWGIEIPPKEVLLSAERVWNLQHLFNLREGLKREDFRWPSRFYQEENGTPPLDPQKVEETLRAYFLARGWDPQTAIPTRKKLEELGLGEEAKRWNVTR